VFRKPITLFLLFSLWPIFIFIVPYDWIPYFQFLIFIQVGFSFNLLFSLKTYLMYCKFPTYSMAVDYYQELNKVKRLEKTTIQKQKQKEKFEKATRIKELKIEQEKQNALNEKLRLQKLLDDLETRKKKVL
jgi:hypothetical protein